MGRDRNVSQGGFGLVRRAPNARIDGLTITGGDTAAGILVNGYARYLQISNNRVMGNHGVFGGGVRIGHPSLVRETQQGLVYQDAYNDGITLLNNQISRNGGMGGAGGGISLYPGAHGYQVRGNFVCGNFTTGDGGGIGHFGLSRDGVIERNTIAFNESFNQGLSVSGGGLSIAGQPPLQGSTLTPGSGSVRVLANTIIGNAAGAGDGGGLNLSRINGQDVASNRNNSSRWHAIDVINNVVVNNVAAWAGGGISLTDATRVSILHDTIANNDSTATAGAAFPPGSPTHSEPQIAGIVSRRHSPELRAVLGSSAATFSDPVLENSIVWHNRSFSFFMDDQTDPPSYGLTPSPLAPVFRDLGVRDGAGTLRPQSCILSDTSGYGGAGNLAADPMFLAEYFNRAPGQTVALPEVTTALQAPPAFDEGGNFIRVGFGPHTLIATDTLMPLSNARLRAGSPAIDAALSSTNPLVAVDADGNTRPWSESGTPRADIGAYERVTP
jgi:hypothetical protein